MPRFIRPTALRLPNETERHATWLELFFDLVFVVIITELATRLFQHFTYLGILQCGALFIPVLWTWVSYTVFAARFDNDDIVHWIMTFVIMFAGVIMAIQIPVALEGGSLGFTIGFLLAHLSLRLLYCRAIPESSTQKNLLILYMCGFGLGDISWIVSLFFSPPTKFILWALGMFFYLATPLIGKKRILSKVPLNTVYIPERFGLFTIIVMGQTIASVVFGLGYAHWSFDSFVTAVMSFILAIIIWGQYYRFTKIADYKCTLNSGQTYIYTHIPLIFSLIVMGVCAELLIITPNKVSEHVNTLFAIATVAYLTSFYLLQYLTIRKFKIRGISYVVGVIAILLLLLFKSVPTVAMSGLVFIFAMLFGIQYWHGREMQKSK
jgi:low temperature requirement protein LtrA